MQKTITILGVGRRPMLEKLPILLQKPVDLATNYLCVAAIDYKKENQKDYITFHFDEGLQMEVNPILSIFAKHQYRITFLNHNPAQLFIRIAVEPVKALLN